MDNFKQAEEIKPIGDLISIDIETADASEEQIQEKIKELTFRKNLKPETLARQKIEAVQKIRNTSALLDGATISSVAWSLPKGKTIVYNWAKVETKVLENKTDNMVTSAQFETEKDMIEGVALWMNDYIDEKQHTLTGWNLKNFDLPQLRLAMARNNIKMPRILTPFNTLQVIDIMRIYAAFYSTSDNRYASLATAVKQFNLDPNGKVLSGAEAPKMFKEGFNMDMNNELHTDFVIYNALDSILTRKITQKIFGIS